MPSYKNPLTLQVQELFIDSELTPEVTGMLLDELNGYFTSKTLLHSNDIPTVIRHLYSIGDHERYSIISVCGFHGYEAVLIPSLQPFLKSTSHKTISFLKESGKYEREVLHAEILKVNQLLKAVLELLRNSTRTTRRAIGHNELAEEFEFPDNETLKVFYECGRKISYDSIETVLNELNDETNAYLCKHCGRYHQGRFSVPGATPVPEGVMQGRYKTAWRRYKKI